ncbi:sigma-70 family RNA polymerase sigma factor [Spiractinospora alimapuensis]|uniref:sigma-70 family RNA polymerase sigma factor n=1 Tax=Spiractinospora alimapuensis TaxID=2820884 RepID=UPI001F360453|nr:sigma-70 family RNA polymerase sigma factor [Spiractinospora alimapuensis]
MDPEPGPEAGGPLGAYAEERTRLRSLAFRVTGSDADAEDALQETWIRAARVDARDIRNPAAWLTTVTTRVCLDLLRKRREVPWDPTDIPEEPGAAPDDQALLASELTEALTVVLERLTPPQRVALVLHDVFGSPFDEVARILDTTPGSAKKLASRARGRVRALPTPASDPDPDARRVVAAFLRAARQGDADGLLRLLHPDVVRTADPQALPAGTAQRVRGADAVVAETRVLRANARRAHLVRVDGRPAIAVGTEAVLLFHVEGGRIHHYDVVGDPSRLALLRVTPTEGGPTG